MWGRRTRLINSEDRLAVVISPGREGSEKDQSAYTRLTEFHGGMRYTDIEE